MEKDFEYKEVETGLPAERALDITSVLAELVPLIGGPLSNIIGGLANARREQRVVEFVQAVSDDLRDFKSQVAEDYVKTEEFEELLENTLRRAAQERSEEKRSLYANIITNAIKHPGGNYDEQIGYVKMLDEIGPDHMLVLRAMLQEPKPQFGMIGTPIQTLRERVPDRSEGQIEALVNRLNDLRITSLTSLRVMMTSDGAANLQGAITPYGRGFLSYIEKA